MRANIAGGFLLCFVLAAGVVSAVAQEPQRGRGTPPPLSTDPYNIWPAKQLSTPGRLGNYGHYSASIQRREVGAAPETHTGFSHFLVFTSGEGNVILGGQIVDGPDGKKVIKGGDTHKIVLNEMYHIPINTAHQVVPSAGSSVTYWVTNINVPK
jgi:mannose-6-phosphate isomerase-like protein (cupin superfamily)